MSREAFLNEPELNCAKALSDKEVGIYIKLRDEKCPNYLKDYNVEISKLAKELGLANNANEDDVEELFKILDVFLHAELIFYETFGELSEQLERMEYAQGALKAYLEKETLKTDRMIFIFFQAAAFGKVLDGQCELCKNPIMKNEAEQYEKRKTEFTIKLQSINERKG